MSRFDQFQSLLNRRSTLTLRHEVQRSDFGVDEKEVSIAGTLTIPYEINENHLQVNRRKLFLSIRLYIRYDEYRKRPQINVELPSYVEEERNKSTRTLGGSVGMMSASISEEVKSSAVRRPFPLHIDRESPLYVSGKKTEMHSVEIEVGKLSFPPSRDQSQAIIAVTFKFSDRTWFEENFEYAVNCCFWENSIHNCSEFDQSTQFQQFIGNSTESIGKRRTTTKNKITLLHALKDLLEYNHMLHCLRAASTDYFTSSKIEFLQKEDNEPIRKALNVDFQTYEEKHEKFRRYVERVLKTRENSNYSGSAGTKGLPVRAS